MINMQEFQQFVNQMKGQDPNQIIYSLIQSGKITQAQLNAAQKQAKELEQEMRNMLGFSSRRRELR